VELRLFNPFLGTRTFAALVLWDFIESGRLARRMHNKLFVADNAVAIMGGRNIGDEYFAARPDLNFEDLDVMAMGPAVQDLSQSFDEFWNNQWAYPAEQWRSGRERAKDMSRAREAVAKLAPRDGGAIPETSLDAPELLPRVLEGQAGVEWARARVVYDPPAKISGGTSQDDGLVVVPEIWALIENTRRELIVISPYFVPGEKGLNLLCRLRQRGVRVRILTNSLGSTDATAAQGGYVRYRAVLLREGVELFELKPTAMSRPYDRRWFRRHATRPQTSLHAKAFIFDRQTVLVGSMNLDRRAHYLNTELGLLIESPAMAEKVAALFAESILPQHSYRMALASVQRVTCPKLANEPARSWPVWITEETGREVRYAHEPGVGLCRKLTSSFLMLLPLEGQL
jgi:cardiolipin synthase C